MIAAVDKSPLVIVAELVERLDSQSGYLREDRSILPFDKYIKKGRQGPKSKHAKDNHANHEFRFLQSP